MLGAGPGEPSCAGAGCCCCCWGGGCCGGGEQRDWTELVLVVGLGCCVPARRRPCARRLGGADGVLRLRVGACAAARTFATLADGGGAWIVRGWEGGGLAGLVDALAGLVNALWSACAEQKVGEGNAYGTRAQGSA
jgi:hypothetical protein